MKTKLKHKEIYHRERVGNKLNSLISVYEESKKDNIKFDECQTLFTDELKKQVEELADMWVRYCKMTYDYKSRLNPDPTAFKRYVEQDMHDIAFVRWFNTFQKKKEECHVIEFTQMDAIIEKFRLGVSADDAVMEIHLK